MSAGWLLSVSLLLELTIVQSGKCPAPQPAFSFSPIYTPVCGSDNLTYANVEALILRNDQAAAGQYSASLEPRRISAIRSNDYPSHLLSVVIMKFVLFLKMKTIVDIYFRSQVSEGDR